MSDDKRVFRSKAQLLLRETWRKAWQAGQLELKFRTESQAHKCRMDLYKAVQPEKQGKGADLELIQASQSLEIVFGTAKNILLIRPRGQNDIFAALQEATGLELDQMRDPDLMQDSQESLKRLKGLGVGVGQEEDPLAAKENPFFTRNR